MLAEILWRMKPATSSEVNQGDTFPDSPHTPPPKERCHPPGHREDSPCPVPTSECSLGNSWPASRMLLCPMKPT